MKLLCDELLVNYRHHSGLEVRPPQSARSFLDYARWQESELTNNGFHEQQTFWSACWDAYGSFRVGPDDLPFTRNRIEGASGFQHIQLSLREETSLGVRNVANAYRVTPHMFFVAAYCIVLARYYGRDRVALWNHFSNRGNPAFSTTVGYFVHTHLVGVDLSGDPTGADLLVRVRRSALNAHRHQEMPLSSLWDAPRRYPQDPDLRLLIDFINVEEDGVEVTPDLTASVTALPPSGIGRFSKLGIYVEQRTDTFSIRVEYASQFHRDGIVTLLRCLEASTEALTRNPTRRISQIIQSFTGFDETPAC
jgi:hypothetical protein